MSFCEKTIRDVIKYIYILGMRYNLPIESRIKRKLRKLFGHSMDVTLPVVASLSLEFER